MSLSYLPHPGNAMGPDLLTDAVVTASGRRPKAPTGVDRTGPALR